MISLYLRHAKKFFGYIFRRENNLTRTINLTKAIINWKILKKEKLDSYPISLTICPGDLCTLNCEVCPTGLKKAGRGRGLLKFEDFKKIIDEVGKYLYEIYLYNWGEPLLNKEIFKMIRYAKKYNIRVIISSNFTLYNEEIGRELIDSKLDLLIISLDGASNNSVARYQKGNNFEKIFSNLVKFVKLRNKYGKKPVVEWRFIVNKYNEDEIEKAKELARKNGIDRIGFECMLPDMADYVLKSEKDSFNELKKWMPNDERYCIFLKNGKKKSYNPSCNWLWLMSTINWDGSVSPCCSIWYEKFDFGNCFSSSFKEVWNNKKYRDARNAIMGKKIDEFNICQVCKKNNAQI